jgi:hypothetical protein
MEPDAYFSLVYLRNSSGIEENSYALAELE